MHREGASPWLMGAGRTQQFTLAAKPCLAPGLEIAYLQTSEFIYVAKFDFQVTCLLPYFAPAPETRADGNSCEFVPYSRAPGPGGRGS